MFVAIVTALCSAWHHAAGGYTTFSTAMVDTQDLWNAGSAETGLAYLFGTLVAALAATWLGVLGARWLLRMRRAQS